MAREAGVTPLMIGTLVDSSRFQGTCYRAANYIHVGEASGRGRQDQLNLFFNPSFKRCYQILASRLAKTSR